MNAPSEDTKPTLTWWSVATSRPVVEGAVRVAAFVGVVLNLVNQGDRLLPGAPPLDIGRALLNFVVPYMVATWSATRFALQSHRDG